MTDPSQTTANSRWYLCATCEGVRCYLTQMDGAQFLDTLKEQIRQISAMERPQLKEAIKQIEAATGEPPVELYCKLPHTLLLLALLEKLATMEDMYDRHTHLDQDLLPKLREEAESLEKQLEVLEASVRSVRPSLAPRGGLVFNKVCVPEKRRAYQAQD